MTTVVMTQRVGTLREGQEYTLQDGFANALIRFGRAVLSSVIEVAAMSSERETASVDVKRRKRG